MKIKITLFALLLSLISFGQDSEYETANSNYKNQNYTEAIAIGEKILQNQYGSVSPLLKIYTTFLVADSYKLLNNYPEAIKRYKEYLEVIKNSSLFNDKIKEKATIDIQKGINEMQSKIVVTEKITNTPQIQQIEKVTINTETETSANPVAKITDTDKTVTQTVSSSGKTIEEAKNNALRSAIEQAFGTFISSKTELLNDNIVKDEIVSVANGNIKNYEIVSQVEIPGNGFGVTIKATVSIDKLTSFAESKGIEIEFKGGLFAQNIKLQKINEQNELTACVNIYSIVHELLQNGFDYTVETEDPKLVKDETYKIKFIVKAKPNANYINAREYLNNSLQKLSMSRDEIATYVKLNKKIYEYKEYYLRSELSQKTLENIVSDYGNYMGNFRINIDNNILINGPDLGFDFHYNGRIPNSYGLIESDYSFFGEVSRPTYPGFMDKNPKEKCQVPREDNQTYQFIYDWEQQFEFNKIQNMQKISITSRGVRSKFKYGGFVIYDDGTKMIIAAPYKYYHSIYDYNSTETQKFGSSVKTSENIFDGKINMELLKNDKSTFFDLISKFNNKYNTDWQIPTANELKLYVTEVYGNIGSTEELLSSSFRPDQWNQNITYWQTSRYFQEVIGINEKSKQFFQDGRPFNSIDAYDILKGLHKDKLKIGWGTRFLFPLIKYVIIK